jgi:hypothetical protein
VYLNKNFTARMDAFVVLLLVNEDASLPLRYQYKALIILHRSLKMVYSYTATPQFDSKWNVFGSTRSKKQILKRMSHSPGKKQIISSSALLKLLVNSKTKLQVETMMIW